MKLVAWIILCLLQMYFLKMDLINPILKSSSHLHQWLVGIVNSRSGELQWFYNAILFGEDKGIRNKIEIKVFIILGLYHIIVVSGSHLVFLERILNKIFFIFPKKIKTCLTGLALVFFTMANLLQPACLRAFLYWILKTFFRFKNSHHTDVQIMAICFCLLIKPDLHQSLSFQLSCSAGLGISVMGNLKLQRRIRKILTPCLCVALTTPLLFSIQPCLSWLVVPVNILALGIVEIIFLPLSLLNFIFPFLIHWTEPLLKNAFKISEILAQNYKPEFCVSTERSGSWGFIYIMVLFLLWRLCLPFLLRREFMRNQTAF